MKKKNTLKLGVITLTILLGLVIGAYEWMLPYPFSKLTVGLSIGAIISILFIGIIFLISKPNRPNLIYITIMSVMLFTILGWLNWSSDSMPETYIISRIALFVGYVLGIFSLYWLTTPEKQI